MPKDGEDWMILGLMLVCLLLVAGLPLAAALMQPTGSKCVGHTTIMMMVGKVMVPQTTCSEWQKPDPPHPSE